MSERPPWFAARRIGPVIALTLGLAAPFLLALGHFYIAAAMLLVALWLIGIGLVLAW